MLVELGLVKQRYQAVLEVLNDGASVTVEEGDGGVRAATRDVNHPRLPGERRSAAVLDCVEAVGADAEPTWFPDDGLVHLDLDTDNVLVGDDGTLTGVVDWECACAGDHRFDLVSFAFDLDGHDQPI